MLQSRKEVRVKFREFSERNHLHIPPYEKCLINGKKTGSVLNKCKMNSSWKKTVRTVENIERVKNTVICSNKTSEISSGKNP